MGNSLLDGAAHQSRAPNIHTFYSSSAWIEGKAEDQLNYIATLKGIKEIVAFPDLHPGRYGPVGSAILSERLHPQLIGNDIGCGMSLFALDLPARKLRAEKTAKRLRVLEGEWREDAAGTLEDAGLSADLFPHSLGTIGGGNHFCEVQIADEIFDKALAGGAGIARNTAYLLVHSGSRGLGTHVFESIAESPADGIDPGSIQGENYLRAHDQAVKWAALNRRIITQRAATAMRAQCRLISDAPHNLVETFEGLWLHRKGAAKADMRLVPLAGSRDSLSYLLHPTGHIKRALSSLAHGAGRKHDRTSMHGRIGRNKSDKFKLQRTSFGGHVVCEDKQLMVEEAPGAYKNVAHVLKDLEAADLAHPVASFKPLVTFKKARTTGGGQAYE